jgi:hypothetical protein
VPGQAIMGLRISGKGVTVMAKKKDKKDKKKDKKK